MISVIITARNAEATLTAAVESCLSQTYADLEMVLIDNGSSDETRALMDSFEDPRVRVFFSGGSHVDAHCLGVENARGGLIARMDADDVCHPRRFEKQVALLHADESLSGCTCGVRVCSLGREIGEGFVKYVDWLNSLQLPEDILRERFIESPVVHPAAMVRKTALLSVGGYQEVEWAEDYDLWLRFLNAGCQIGMVPEILFDWYDSDTRLTRTDGRYSQENFLRAKAHYLAKLGDRFEICGAGPIGKRIGRFLLDEGVAVNAFYEVNPRRIGENIAGVSVLEQAAMRCDGNTILLGAVGLKGARGVIRGLAVDQGFVEGVDFFCVA